jgi:hypothetical protein
MTLFLGFASLQDPVWAFDDGVGQAEFEALGGGEDAGACFRIEEAFPSTSG